jgi:hypothetical protein
MPADLKKRGILTLLDHGSSLRIPVFQRSFAWEPDQADDFWEDLLRALDRDGGSAEYFLGLIVVDENWEIQDGQQRLATTLMFAGAIYEVIEEARADPHHDQDLAVNAIGLVTPALRTGRDAPLTLSPADQSVLLQRVGIRADSPESTKRLDKVRRRLSALVHADVDGLATADERLRRMRNWAEFLRTQAYVIQLKVPPRDAHNIFETLNTRGVRLSNGDLVKSHLIARVSSADTPAAIAKWNDVIGALKDDRGAYETDLESFLLHYYGSRYGQTVKRDLFTDFRNQVSGDDPLTTLDDLHENAILYRALVAPAGADAYWTTLGTGTRQAVELVNALNLRQLRYLLLAVLRDLAPNVNDSTRRRRQGEAVRRAAAWSVRGLVLRLLSGGTAEDAYITAATAIRAGTIDTVAKLKAHFIDKEILNEDDALFEEEFRTYTWDSKTNHTKARAILYALEVSQIPNRSALTARQTLTVEHVLPKSPGPGDWAQFTPDERDVYTYRLGNLLLIDGPSRANDSLGNSGWPAKKRLIQGYGAQTPLTTAALAKTTWSRATINDRQVELAAIALQAFPL